MRASTLGPAQHVSIIRSQLNVTQKYLPTTDGAGRIKDRVKASLVGGGDFQERSQYSKAQVKEYNVFIPHRPNCWLRDTWLPLEKPSSNICWRGVRMMNFYLTIKLMEENGKLWQENTMCSSLLRMTNKHLLPDLIVWFFLYAVWHPSAVCMPNFSSIIDVPFLLLDILEQFKRSSDTT